ncbi:hypothetical protein J6590_105623 [Homalodisca vitripennis]|nr:hypothetical protein J6590_105623 [Homalodisca vitripennis]
MCPACYKIVDGFSNSSGSSLGSVVVTRLTSLTNVPSLLRQLTADGFSNTSGPSLGSAVVTRLASLTTVPGLLQDSWWVLQLEWIQPRACGRYWTYFSDHCAQLVTRQLVGSPTRVDPASGLWSLLDWLL